MRQDLSSFIYIYLRQHQRK